MKFRIIVAVMPLLLLTSGCGEKPKPKMQPVQPTPRPTPPTRILSGEEAPIDRQGSVLELDVPDARQQQGAIGPFEGSGASGDLGGAMLSATGTGTTGSGDMTDSSGKRVPSESGSRVIPLSEYTQKPAEDEENELPEPFKKLQREEPQPSKATADFRRRVRESVDQIREKPPEGEEAPPKFAIDGRDIVLNFENADIQDLILQLQDEGVLPLNYILDASVQGSITIKTSDPIAAEDLLDVILTILQANGLTIVKDGDFFRIIAAGEAKSFNIETYVTHSSDAVQDVNEVVTIIVPLEYISTEQAVAVLAQFQDKDANVIQYQPGNLLFMTGFSSRLKRLLQILELVDIGTSREELRVYQIYHTSAEDLKATIDQIISGDFAARFAEAQGAGRRRRQQPAAGAGAGQQPIIIADPRSNRLIAFASKRELEFMERIIELLDQEIVVSDKIYIYSVENAEAAQLASTLEAIYGEQVTSSGGGSSGAGASGANVGVVPGGTTIIDQDNLGGVNRPGLRNRGGRQTGNRPAQRPSTRQGTGTQRGTPRGTGTQSSRGDMSDASNPDEAPDVGSARNLEEAAGAIAAAVGPEESIPADDSTGEPDGQVAQMTSAQGVREPHPVVPGGNGRAALGSDEYYDDLLLKSGSGLVSGEINVVADERTNFLIVKTSPSNWPAIKETIRRLDIQPKQVLIDILIAEVTLDETNEFGIEWSILSENTIGDYTFQGTTQTDFGVNNSNTGFTYTLLEATRFRGFLRAFANTNELEVLSRPHLLASNNAEASFEVGDQIPVVTQQFQSGTVIGQPPAQTGVFNSIEYRDTGILLSITPRINAANFVTLDADVEISQAQSNNIGGTDQPIIRQRHVTTSVVVAQSQTLLIGGIMQQNLDNSQQGVPWIRRVPILKYLFGTTKKQIRKTELFIAITPHVLPTPLEASVQSATFQQSLSTHIDELIRKGGRPRRWWEP